MDRPNVFQVCRAMAPRTFLTPRRRRSLLPFAVASVGNDLIALTKRSATMIWPTTHYSAVARAAAWIGLLAIIILSVVPAKDRPVTGAGQWLEHLAAFALVGGAFAMGYRLLITRLLFLVVFFCAGIELLQVPLPTRHARVSDFLIDTAGACFAVFCIFLARWVSSPTMDEACEC